MDEVGTLHNPFVDCNERTCSSEEIPMEGKHSLYLTLGAKFETFGRIDPLTRRQRGTVFIAYA
jgi:hypothetical protein